MDAGEGVGVLLASKTLVEGQRERVCPCHIFRERLRGGRPRWAFYSTSPVGSALQSAAAGDLATNFHCLSRERLVAVVQSGEPNSYWLRLPRRSTAGSREALQRLMLRLEQETPRQGRLIEEEEEEVEVVGEGEASACSSRGTPKLA